MNPILGRINRRCSSLRAGIIDSLATRQGIKEQLGFATVAADRFQTRPGEKKLVAGAGLEIKAWVSTAIPVGGTWVTFHLKLRG